MIEASRTCHLCALRSRSVGSLAPFGVFVVALCSKYKFGRVHACRVHVQTNILLHLGVPRPK